MKKLSLLCAALLAVGCSNQGGQVIREAYVGATPIKVPAPKDMQDITPDMGPLYELSMQVRTANPDVYYFAEYLNLTKFFSTTNSCAAFIDREFIYPSLPHNYFTLLKSSIKSDLEKLSVSKNVTDAGADSKNKLAQLAGSSNEYQGVRILQYNVLFEDDNTLVHSILYEDVLKSAGKTKENISVVATSYVKDKIISLKCESTKPEYKSELSSLVLDWNKAFLAANK